MLAAAVKSGDAKKVAELIRQDPGFDVNITLKGSKWTLLHHACIGDRRSALIPLLLAHPDIDVNVKTKYGGTPFYYACWNGYTSCVCEMLKDSRVKVNEPDNGGSTPLYFAAFYGYLDVIKWWIASGREMDLGTPGDAVTDAIGRAKKFDETEVATLLERFKSDAAQTKHAMRVEIGWYDNLAAEMFALVVFVSDGLLQVNDTATPSPAARYLKIARRLPLELQMLLCFRQVGSAREIIPSKVSEGAFKELAETLVILNIQLLYLCSLCVISC